MANKDKKKKETKKPKQENKGPKDKPVKKAGTYFEVEQDFGCRGGKGGCESFDLDINVSLPNFKLPF